MRIMKRSGVLRMGRIAVHVDRVLGRDDQGKGRGRGRPSTVTITLGHHLEHRRLGLGDARLISSASTMLAKTGPGWNSRRPLL